MSMDNKKPGGIQPAEHIPNLESKAKVVGFTCAGFSQEHIANYFDIDLKTLRKHYREELDKSKMDKIMEVSDTAYKRAMDGSDKMITLILTTQARWAAAKNPEDHERDKKMDTLLEKLVDKL